MRHSLRLLLDVLSRFRNDTLHHAYIAMKHIRQDPNLLWEVNERCPTQTDDFGVLGVQK